MGNYSKMLIALATMLIFILPLSAQETEQRLNRIEAKLDTLLSFHREVTPTLENESIFEDSIHIPWGIGSDIGLILNKEYFIINHNSVWKIPYWVGYYLSTANLQGTESRTDNFRPDPEIPPGSRAELTDYSHSGYDRGHNAPAAAFKRNREAMSTTFLLSNMSPQTPSLNRRIWRMLEEQVRNLVLADGEAWVITGNLFMSFDSLMVSPSELIGSNNVAIPTHCFKMILSSQEDGGLRMYAFLMPNQRDRIPGEPADYLITVDRLEEITGYDFFPNLEDNIENRLEALMPSVWPR